MPKEKPKYLKYTPTTLKTKSLKPVLDAPDEMTYERAMFVMHMYPTRRDVPIALVKSYDKFVQRASKLGFIDYREAFDAGVWDDDHGPTFAGELCNTRNYHKTRPNSDEQRVIGKSLPREMERKLNPKDKAVPRYWVVDSVYIHKDTGRREFAYRKVGGGARVNGRLAASDDVEMYFETLQL